jgi:hypothetical protein
MAAQPDHIEEVVIYRGGSLVSVPFINVSGYKFYLNTNEFASGSSKVSMFSATGTLRKSVYIVFVPNTR